MKRSCNGRYLYELGESVSTDKYRACGVIAGLIACISCKTMTCTRCAHLCPTCHGLSCFQCRQPYDEGPDYGSKCAQCSTVRDHTNETLRMTKYILPGMPGYEPYVAAHNRRPPSYQIPYSPHQTSGPIRSPSIDYDPRHPQYAPRSPRISRAGSRASSIDYDPINPQYAPQSPRISRAWTGSGSRASSIDYDPTNQQYAPRSPRRIW